MPPCSLPLAAGQTLVHTLAAGDELFCAGGRLQLQTSAMAGIDALPGLALQLPAGQSWRAPQALVVRITAVGAAARMRCKAAAPSPLAPLQATHWPARLGTWIRNWRTLGT